MDNTTCTDLPSPEILDSVLDTTKKMLDISPDYKAFDINLVVFINGVFSTLHQMGVGSEQPFTITGRYEKWADFIQSDETIESVKTYVALSVRLAFDPPGTSFAVTAIEKQIEQLGWRLANSNGRMS